MEYFDIVDENGIPTGKIKVSFYEENKKKRLGDTTPKRMRYKKLISD